MATQQVIAIVEKGASTRVSKQLAWLLGHDHYQSSIARLPEEVRQLLSQSTLHESAHGQLLGLVKVVQGVEFRDPFAIISEEGRVQHEFHHKNGSAYSVRVTHAAIAQHSPHARLLGSTFGSGSFRAEQPLYVMTSQSLECVLSADFQLLHTAQAVTGRDLLQQFGRDVQHPGSLHALALPWQIALLVLHGVWSEILVLLP